MRSNWRLTLGVGGPALQVLGGEGQVLGDDGVGQLHDARRVKEGGVEVRCLAAKGGERLRAPRRRATPLRIGGGGLRGERGGVAVHELESVLWEKRRNMQKDAR